MSLFARFPSNDMNPLFRLLDDYNTQSTGGFNSSVRAFQPKFDVREHKDSYELQGELPGVDQKDVHIQFADPHTLVIKGRVEREYSSDGSEKPRGRITGDVTESSPSRKATVEDENEEATNGNATKNKDVSKPSEKKVQHNHGSRYWVSERSVGEFHRAFTFPSRVDQDVVKAKLNNGILSVVVPKATAHEGKRIMVE